MRVYLYIFTHTFTPFCNCADYIKNAPPRQCKTGKKAKFSPICLKADQADHPPAPQNLFLRFSLQGMRI